MFHYLLLPLIFDVIGSKELNISIKERLKFSQLLPKYREVLCVIMTQNLLTIKNVTHANGTAAGGVAQW